jgi:hypothetical protein
MDGFKRYRGARDHCKTHGQNWRLRSRPEVVAHLRLHIHGHDSILVLIPHSDIAPTSTRMQEVRHAVATAGQRPTIPADCPTALAHLMRECWHPVRARTSARAWKRPCVVALYACACDLPD